MEGGWCQRHHQTHLLRQFLSTKVFWERESLRLVPRDPNLVNATNNINVLILVLHICLRARLCLAHTAYFAWSLRASHRTILASLSSNFLLGDIKKGNGKQQLELSKKVSNKLLHVGYIISFTKIIFSLMFTMNDLSACNDVINIFKGTLRKETQISLFLNFIPWFVYKSSTSVIPPTTRLQQLEC